MESGRSCLVNYERYQFSARENVFYAIIGLGIASMLGYIFYHSIFACVILGILIPYYMNLKKEELCEKQKQELNEQFKETIIAVSAGLRAGYSIENAFRGAFEDIAMMYGKESIMGKELFYFTKGLDNNVVLEQLLEDLAVRSGIDNICDFSEIFRISKRRGGDMSSVIYSCVTCICEKIEVKREIQILINAKQYEQKIMNAVPLLIILYIQYTSPGFFDPLYHNTIGIFIMTICLFVYGAAYLMAKRITKIQV